MQEAKTKIEPEEIRSKVIKGLSGSLWDKVLGYWLKDDGFLEVIKTLIQHTEQGRRWLPGAPRMLRFLKECPYNKVKAVIITGEHSLLMDSNVGIPLHLDKVNRGKEGEEKWVYPKPTYTIWDMHDSLGVPREQQEYDITPWCKQGVLMLSTTPTTRENGHHHGKLWEPTIHRIIEAINRIEDIPVVIIGQLAKPYEEYLHTSNIRYIETGKPGGWNDHEWAAWVNQKLESQGKKVIKWYYTK